MFGARPVHKKKGAAAARRGKVAVRSQRCRAPPCRRAPRYRRGLRLQSQLTRAGAAQGSRWVQTWDEPTLQEFHRLDNPDGEDLVVRKAAAEALGRFQRVDRCGRSHQRAHSVHGQPETRPGLGFSAVLHDQGIRRTCCACARNWLSGPARSICMGARTWISPMRLPIRTIFILPTWASSWVMSA